MGDLTLRVTKRLRQFAVTHRLGGGYVGKCCNIHGHTYFCDITIQASTVDCYGMALDFGEIKTMFDDWIQANWDHATLVGNHDHALLNFLKAERSKYFELPFMLGGNTTAENMAIYLFRQFQDQVEQKDHSRALKLVSVRIWETPDAYAEVLI